MKNVYVRFDTMPYVLCRLSLCVCVCVHEWVRESTSQIKPKNATHAIRERAMIWEEETNGFYFIFSFIFVCVLCHACGRWWLYSSTNGIQLHIFFLLFHVLSSASHIRFVLSFFFISLIAVVPLCTFARSDVPTSIWISHDFDAEFEYSKRKSQNN